MSTRKTTGSCLCGGVQVTLVGEPIVTNLCHCTSCQKVSGNVFVALGVFKAEQLTLTPSDPSLIKTYEDTTPESGNVLLRRFCGRCSSPLCGSKANMPDMVSVPAGLFACDNNNSSHDEEQQQQQQDTMFRPSVEYFARRRADWVVPVEGATAFDTLPSQ